MTFEDRIAAQEAIERVYYFHQVGAVVPFEEAKPGELLTPKVVEYLKQTAALEQFWQTPVTAEMLERELQRLHVPDHAGHGDPDRESGCGRRVLLPQPADRTVRRQLGRGLVGSVARAGLLWWRPTSG